MPLPRIDPNEQYPDDSLGAEVLRICDTADRAIPGFGALLLAKWNAPDEIEHDDTEPITGVPVEGRCGHCDAVTDQLPCPFCATPEA